MDEKIIKRRIIFRRLIQLLIITAIFLMTIATMNNENDIFWQLKMGQDIWEKHFFPIADPYNHSNPGAVWTLEEWTSSTLFYVVYKYFSWNGLIFLKAGVIALTFSLFMYLFNKLKVNLYLSFFVFLLAAMVNSRGIWVVFPSIFEYLFIVMTLLIMEFKKTFDWKTVLVLGFFSWIWAGAHASFFLFTGIVFAYILGSYLTEKLQKKWPDYLPLGRILNKADRIKLLIVVLVSLITPIISPNGIWTWIYPFRISFGRFTTFVSEYQRFYKVWQWEWSDFVISFTFILIVILVGLLILGRRKLHPTDLFLALAFIVLSQMAVRHVAVFALVALFLIAKYTRLWFGEYRGIFKRSLIKDFFLILFIISFVFYYKTKIIPFGLGAVEIGYPKKEAEIVNEFKIPGKMYNHYNYGGYLIWKMPDYQVFIDGRLEMYHGQAGRDYEKILTGREGYKELMEKYQINFAINYLTDPLTETLINDSDWKLIESDGDFVLLVRNTEANRELINKYWSEEKEQYLVAIYLKKIADQYNNMGADEAKKGQEQRALAYFYQVISYQPEHLQARLNIAQICMKYGLNKEAMAQYMEVLKYYPENEDALQNLEYLNKIENIE